MTGDTEPTRQLSGKLQDCKSLQAALQHPAMLERMKAACPSVLSPERMLRVAALCVSKTKNLDQCDMMDVLGAFLMLGSLGLEPNTVLGHAYLIPFKGRKKVGNAWKDVYNLQVIIGYTGYIALAYRSGVVKGIHADVVYEGDEFSFSYGSDAHVRHTPKGGRKRKALYAYCHAQLADGGQAFTVLPWEHVMDVRNASQGYKAALAARNREGGRGEAEPAWASSPWVAHVHPMGAKTAVRAMRPYLPMSVELARASEIEDASSQGASFGAVFDTTSDNIDAMSPEPFSEEKQRQVSQEDPGPDLGLNREEPEREKVERTEKREAPKEEPKTRTVDIPEKAKAKLELFNLEGESVWQGSDLTEFAEGFMAIFDEDPGAFKALRDLNKDAYDAARRDEKARFVLHEEAQEDERQEDFFVPMKTTRQGGQDILGYLSALAELVNTSDGRELDLVIERNQPVYEQLPGTHKLSAMKLIGDRKRRLGK